MLDYFRSAGGLLIELQCHQGYAMKCNMSTGYQKGHTYASRKNCAVCLLTKLLAVARHIVWPAPHNQGWVGKTCHRCEQAGNAEQ